MTIVVDASSIILMAKITLLEKLTEKNKLIAPEKVYTEVLRGKEKARHDAFLVERLVKENKLKIEKVSEKEYEKIRKLFGLWAGEAEVLALSLKHKLPIITDDKKCLNAAKSININCMTSLDVTITLLNKRQVDKQKALSSLEALEEYGWYKREIIKFYKEKIK